MAGSYLLRIKVLPTGPEVPPAQLLESLKGAVTKEMTIKSSKEDPIAFGLYSLILDVIAPEEEGMVDRVEQAIAKAPMVAQYEVLGVSRMSSRLKV